jgi:hypothetical protein
MTVSTLNFYKVYIATALQTVFPYDFQILAAADIRVYDNGTLMTLGVDYTVSGAGTDGGGNVTFLVGRTAGHSILLRRETPRTQATDLNAGQQFYEATLEAMADKLTLIEQESHGAMLPLSPASYYLRINSSGTGIEAVAVVTGGVAMPFDTGLAAPVDGTWALGFIRFNSAPVLGGNVGWICTTGGTPGTWAEFGFISANPA